MLPITVVIGIMIKVSIGKIIKWEINVGHSSFVPGLTDWLIFAKWLKTEFCGPCWNHYPAQNWRQKLWELRCHVVTEPTTQTIIGNFCEPAVLSLVMESGASFNEQSYFIIKEDY